MRDAMRYKSPLARLRRIGEIIEAVDHRCMAADGPVTNTRHEMSDDEMRSIYELACGYPDRRGRGSHPRGKDTR